MPRFILMTISYLVSLILTFSSFFVNINGQSMLEIANRFSVVFAPVSVSHVI